MSEVGVIRELTTDDAIDVIRTAARREIIQLVGEGGWIKQESLVARLASRPDTPSEREIAIGLAGSLALGYELGKSAVSQ